MHPVIDEELKKAFRGEKNIGPNSLIRNILSIVIFCCKPIQQLYSRLCKDSIRVRKLIIKIN